jgi:hypothetical protein
LTRSVFASVLAVLLAACSAGAGDDPTTTTVAVTTTSTTEATTTTVPPRDCPPAPYELGFLPAGVGQGEPDTGAEPDVWTSVAGSHTTFVPRSDDTVAIAIVRGTLPAVDWPNEKGEVSVDGTPGVVGPHPDGTWVAGWFEEPGERCDLYTMVFYPPWSPSDVEQVLEEMDRVGG